jgi:hypothetical protein
MGLVKSVRSCSRSLNCALFQARLLCPRPLASKVAAAGTYGCKVGRGRGVGPVTFTGYAGRISTQAGVSPRISKPTRAHRGSTPYIRMIASGPPPLSGSRWKAIRSIVYHYAHLDGLAIGHPMRVEGWREHPPPLATRRAASSLGGGAHWGRVGSGGESVPFGVMSPPNLAGSVRSRYMLDHHGLSIVGSVTRRGRARGAVRGPRQRLPCRVRTPQLTRRVVPTPCRPSP